MNKSGYEIGITDDYIYNFTDENTTIENIAEELQKEYYFSEWYPIFEESNINTPKSYI